MACALGEIACSGGGSCPVPASGPAAAALAVGGEGVCPPEVGNGHGPAHTVSGLGQGLANKAHTLFVWPLG